MPTLEKKTKRVKTDKLSDGVAMCSKPHAAQKIMLYQHLSLFTPHVGGSPPAVPLPLYIQQINPRRNKKHSHDYPTAELPPQGKSSALVQKQSGGSKKTVVLINRLRIVSAPHYVYRSKSLRLRLGHRCAAS